MSPLDPARLRPVPALLLGCLVLVALGLCVAPPAAAHPFGDPQTLEVSAQDGDVRLRWKAGGTDDLTALALHLGLLPADRVMLDGAVLYEEGDGPLLAAAPAFADYLLERVRVRVLDGADRCSGEVLSTDELAVDGAVLSFDCGSVADEVVVESRMLTDLHPDYRALASGPGGQRAVYDDDDPEHTWALTGTPATSGGTASSAAVQLGSVLGLVAVGGVGGAFYVRRRGRREAAAAA